MSYTCDSCGGTFEECWSDEEAIAEFREKFPAYPLTEARRVCDDCYRKIMELPYVNI
jgi:hypothetical protein